MSSVDGEEAMAQGVSGREDERILVSVRVRPLNEKEAARSEVVDWECISDTTIVHKSNVLPERSVYPTTYTFDRVFRCNCSTRQVYEEGAKAVVLSVVRGINSSVFAYGQTSSGKTFTMSGITEYTMVDIFDYIQKHKERDFHLKFSALEIYNESVRDLLTSDNSPLRLLDDPERGTVVEKLTEESLRDWNHFQELLAICEAQRQIGETFLNEVSSRSHQILRLTIESSTREYLGKNNSSTLAATLNFVDLAGSERASQALSAGSRLKEGSHINRSLLTLGTVIRKLSKGGIGHIPYRDSKLTRILQSSLGGNARTAVICTMSPARSYAEQSRNTLLFASCAKEVTTNAHVNVVLSDKALVRHLQRELARLETELQSTSPAVKADAMNLLRDKESKIEELERRVEELTLELDRALSQINDLQQGGEDQSQITWEGEVSSYPKLHVRQASEASSSDATTVMDNHSFDARSPASGSPYSLDGESRRSYDENYSISDFDENLPPTSPFERMFIETSSDASTPILIQTSNVAGNIHHRNRDSFGEQNSNLSEVDPYMVYEGTGGQTPNFSQSDSQLAPEEQNLDQFEIRLQQVSNENGSQSPYFVDFDPYHVSDHDYGEQSPISFRVGRSQVSEETIENPSSSNGMDPHQSGEAHSKLTENHSEDYCKEVQCIESANIHSCSLPVDEETRPLSVSHEKEGCKDDEQEACDEPSEGKQFPVDDAKEPSGTQLTDDLPEFKNVNCVEKSFQSEDMNASSLSEDKVQYEMKKDNTDRGENFIDRKEGVHRKSSALNDDADDGALQIPSADYETDEDETPVTEIKVSDHRDYAEKHTSSTTPKEISKALSVDETQPPNIQVEETLQKANNSTKKMKDAGFSPQDDLNATASWPSDSKSLQREIIDLWDVCNISLVHRTCFYLVFIKGDPADTIYLEVERRRLSCIRDAFAWGNSIDLDSLKLTPTSSRRSLHHERVMLAGLMKRRLSSQERVDLYVKWGISLDSKRRRSQLVDRLWIDTLDLNHVEESANIVAKVVRFSEPQVPKEVFGLNLMTKTNNGRRRSFGWKPNPSIL